MTISAAGSTASMLSQRLVDMRSQFDDLQRQLSTGQKSDTYAGLGLDRGLAVSLNGQQSAINSYNTTIDNVMTRINVAQSALTAVGKVSSSLGSALSQGSDSPSNGNTTQVSAQSWLQQLVGLLNTQAGDRYVFSGSATNQPSTASYDQIINGDATHAGLTQVITERNQADLGQYGLGRLTVTSPSSGTVQVAQTLPAGAPFGFALSSATSTLSNATVSSPSGSPPSLSVSFSGQPSAGQSVTLGLTLPDGSTSNLTLTATTDSPPGANQFTIGGSSNATATNLQAAITTALGTAANTTLKAASTMAASKNFFDNPPMRVSGTPATATSLIAGTSADTVIWYTGGNTSSSARDSATARIDQSLTVSYGTRANEDGIRAVVQSAATRAAVSVSSGDPNGANYISALDQRLSANIDGSGGTQTVTDIEAELAGVQTSMQSVKANHTQTSNTLGSFLDQIQGVSNEQVGTELLALQTRMQASMQTTAMLYQTSLVNYMAA